MTPIREAYLSAAASAADLLRNRAVAARWDAPSALAEFSVRGLAGHLAGQILFVAPVLSEPPPEGEPVSLMEHYGRVTWIGADLDDEVNILIRRLGENFAPTEQPHSSQARMPPLRNSGTDWPPNRRTGSCIRPPDRGRCAWTTS